MHRQKYSVELKPSSKLNQSLNLSNSAIKQRSSLDQRIGVTRMSQSILIPKTPRRSRVYSIADTGKKRQAFSSSKIYDKRRLVDLKLPTIRQSSSFFQNPEQKLLYKKIKPETTLYYQSTVYNSFHTSKQTNYLLTLAVSHFQQTVQALKIGKQMKINGQQQATVKLHKRNPKFKTVYLDLDQTLVHCDQNSTSCTVKLQFPVQNDGIITAGIRIRPHCKQFLQQLSKIAEIIIFTASSQSYADVVLDYLDPGNKIFSHRLYRNHCRLEKGYYLKDLRVVNRRLEDSVLVDNSAVCFMLQPFNGVPVLPFYHYGKDRELVKLLEWLRQLVKEGDVRHGIKRMFFWQKYFENDNDPRKIFQSNYQASFGG